MIPHGARPLAGTLLVLALAACQASPATSPSAVPAPTATAASSPGLPSPSAVPTPPAASVSPEPSAQPSIAPEAQAYAAQGEANDVLFAPDGRIVMVTRDFNANRSQVAELDASGAVLPGWPWSAGDTGSPIATAALGPEGSIYVAVRGAVGGAGGDAETYTWSLHRLDASGGEAAGFPVALPPVSACSLSVAEGGAAYTACEHEDAETGVATTTLSVVRPDGSAADGWPITVDGSATIDGFLPDGSVVAWAGTRGGSKLLAIRPDGSDSPGWPRPAPDGGYASVDGAGRVRVTSRTWEEDQCGAATGTTYSVLAADGSVLPGWPVHRKGWASDPLVADDGSMTILTQGGKALRYGLDGSAAGGWSVSDVDVAVGCYSGSSPVAAGDGDTMVVAGKATLLTPSGEVAAGWPVKLPFPAAIECPGCTPGPAAPLAPAIGADALYVAAYGGDRPRAVTLGRDGSLVEGGQRVLGTPGEQIAWIRIAPSGRVWMLLTRSVDETTTTRLVPVAQDRVVGS